MLAALFFIFSMSLFLVRLACYRSVGLRWCAINLLSGLFMFIAFYYFIFPPASTAIILTTTGSMVTNTISTTTEAGVPVNSQGFILLATITIFYILFMVIFMVRDFLEAKNIGRIKSNDMGS